MRREERHHLKENPLALVLSELRGWMSEQGRNVATGVVIVLVALIAAGGYFAWSQVQKQRAGELLAGAMAVLTAPVVAPPEVPDATTPASEDTAQDPVAAGGTDGTVEAEEEIPAETQPAPVAEVEDGDEVETSPPDGSYTSMESKLTAALPRLLDVVETYPNTQQGVVAQYEAAAVLMMLGREDDAAAGYRAVIERAGDGLYGQMAVMGLAEASLGSGETQGAIALLEERAAAVESLIPIDAVLMRLGRAYEMSGQPDDALSTFSRIVHEFPISVYSTEAQDALVALEQGQGAESSSPE
jgi:TolA-binding protein